MIINLKSFYSLVSLCLAGISYGLISYIISIDTEYRFEQFDLFVLRLTGNKWWYASMDIEYFLFIAIPLILLLLSVWLGIKSVHTNGVTNSKFRLLNIICATIAGATFITMILSIIFL